MYFLPKNAYRLLYAVIVHSAMSLDVVARHHPYKHWLVKIKNKVQDAGGTSVEHVDKSDETLSSFALRVYNIAAMVECCFDELDLCLGERLTQIDQLVHWHSLTELMGMHSY